MEKHGIESNEAGKAAISVAMNLVVRLISRLRPSECVPSQKFVIHNKL